MATPQDTAATPEDEETQLVESSSFPSVLSRFAEFATDSTINEIRTCVEVATRDSIAAGQNTALFTIDAVKQVLRSSSIQTLLAQQQNVQSSSRNAFATHQAFANCQSSYLFAVDFANRYSMVRKENDPSPSPNLEGAEGPQTVEAHNPSFSDVKSASDMQSLMASSTNLPENAQPPVLYKLSILGDSNDCSNALKGVCHSAGWSSACASGTTVGRPSRQWYSSTNNESIMEVVNREDRKADGKQSGNDSGSPEGTISPHLKYENYEKGLMLDFQLKANVSEGADSQLALRLNSKCSISDELDSPSSNVSHHVQSLQSSEPQNKRPLTDQMLVRFSNWHFSPSQNRYTEGKSNLTVANKSHNVSLSLREMQRMYLGEPLHACPVCKITFRYANMLKVHAKLRHNEDQPFPCTVCEKKFDRYAVLTQHMYSHGVSPTYKCEICGEIFNYQSRLIRHNRLAHFEVFGLTRPARCMAYPVFTATRKGPATPSDPTVPSSTTEDPSTSVAVEHCRDERLFTCVFCGKKFNSKALLSQHMKSHEWSSTYECETCGQSFNFQSGLAKHRSVHSEAVRHVCSVCRMAFSNPNNLKRHQATHLNSTDVKQQTKKTPRSSPSSRTDSDSVVMCRRGLRKEFSCTFCEKSFDKEILLSQHMKSHEWRPSYTCDTCGQTFNFQSSLMKHQSVHSDGTTSPPGASSSY